jgi:hypothetical protein
VTTQDASKAEMKRLLLETLLFIHLALLGTLGWHAWSYRVSGLEEGLADMGLMVPPGLREAASLLVREARNTGIGPLLERARSGVKEPVRWTGNAEHVPILWVLAWAIAQPRVPVATRAEILDLLALANFDLELPDEQLRGWLHVLSRQDQMVSQSRGMKLFTRRIQVREWLAGLAALGSPEDNPWHPPAQTLERTTPEGRPDSRAILGEGTRLFLALSALYQEAGLRPAFQMATTRPLGLVAGRPPEDNALARAAFLLWLAEQPEVGWDDRHHCLAWMAQLLMPIPTSPAFLLNLLDRLDDRVPEWRQGAARPALLALMTTQRARRLAFAPPAARAALEAGFAPLFARLELATSSLSP